MSETEPEWEQKSQSLLAVCLWGPCLLLLYVLSPGPILFLVHNESVPDWMSSALIVLISPLEWMYENVSMAHEFYDWYLSLLRVK